MLEAEGEGSPPAEATALEAGGALALTSQAGEADSPPQDIVAEAGGAADPPAQAGEAAAPSQDIVVEAGGAAAPPAQATADPEADEVAAATPVPPTSSATNTSNPGGFGAETFWYYLWSNLVVLHLCDAVK